jgi:hypothetical protein
MKHLLLLIILVLVNLNSFACSCVGTETTKEAVAKSDIVFRGNVTGKAEIRLWVQDTTEALAMYQDFQKQDPTNSLTYLAFKERTFSILQYEYTFRVTKFYKGKSEEQQIKVRTGTDSGNCGYPFQLNQEYLVYGYFAVENNFYSPDISKDERKVIPGIYQTSICTKTTGLANAKNQLKELKKP